MAARTQEEMKQLIQQGLSKEELKQFALSNQWNEQSGEYRELLSYLYEKERKAGFRLIGIGAVILIISCMATIVLYHNHIKIDGMMYTSSVVGLGIAFWGCTKVL